MKWPRRSGCRKRERNRVRHEITMAVLGLKVASRLPPERVVATASDGTELTAADVCRVQKNRIWELAGGAVLNIVERDVKAEKRGDTEQEP